MFDDCQYINVIGGNSFTVFRINETKLRIKFQKNFKSVRIPKSCSTTIFRSVLIFFLSIVILILLIDLIICNLYLTSKSAENQFSFTMTTWTRGSIKAGTVH